MSKQQYYCFAKGVEQFDVNGKSLGIGHDRAIYYSKQIGRRRLYRIGYPIPDKGFTLLTFKTKINAQETCDHTNEIYNDRFKVATLTNTELPITL